MKKLLMFLMLAIPLVVILVVNLTVNAVGGEINVSVDRVEISFVDDGAIKVGESKDLTCKIYPENATNKDVVWSSENEQVATVDNTGHVEFVGFGSTYITATTSEGKRGSCYFYVTDSKVHKVELSAEFDQDFVYIGKTLQLTANVLPDEAENKEVTFVSSNYEIADVNLNGLVSGISEGHVTITAISADGHFPATYDLDVLIPVSSLTVDQTEIVTSSSREQVNYHIMPENATRKGVLFSVDNPDVAEVNHLGVITFKQQGEVKLTITTLDGGFSQTITYIYTGGYASELVVDTPPLVMTVGDEVYIKYHTIPSYIYSTEVELSSDNEDIAYFVNGRYLRALKGGGTVVRLRVHTSPNEVIERQLLVMVESPATSISISDGVTATNTYQLLPQSLPEGSTNKAYFYHLSQQDSAFARVTEDGLITFLGNEPCTAHLTIYANEDYSNVKKQVNITFTAGGAVDASLTETELIITYPETANLNFNLTPQNATNVPYEVSLISSSGVQQGSVIEIVDGAIKAVGGGQASVKVQITLYDGSTVEQTCHITVIRPASDVSIKLDIDYFNNEYVTAKKEVDFSGEVYPADATDKHIVWLVSNKTLATISGNKLIFKQEGSVILTARVGEVEKSVPINYTSSTPVYAEVKAVKDGEECEIPKTIRSGESFQVKIGTIIPTNNTSATLSLQVKNQRTASLTGKVLEVDGNTVSALSGGSATLIIYVSGSLRLRYDIVVERLPESLTIINPSSVVTAQSIEIEYEVLPVDTTNKTINFVVENNSVAYFEGNKLIFKQNGVAHILAYCVADNSIKQVFDIEKVESSAILINLSENNVSVNKGDVLAFDLAGEFELKIVSSQPTIEGQEVASLDGNYIKTLAAGIVEVEVLYQQKTYNLTIQVKQLVEEIRLVSNLDVFDDEYVLAGNSAELKFEIYPAHAFNTAFDLSIKQQTSTDGKLDNIAFLSNGKINFIQAGSVVIQASSQDGNATALFRLRCTGGDALDAELNVGNSLVLEVGEEQQIKVSTWLPKDTINTTFVMYEAQPSRLISINNKTQTITALASGQTQLVVELSNGITKEISISITKKVTDILVEENILTANERYEIIAFALPEDATNTRFEYVLEPTQIANITGNTVYFIQAGTVKVVVKATDGSKVQKTVSITSTKGYVSQIEFKQSQIELNKAQQIQLEVSCLPADWPNGDVQFKIVSSAAADGSNNQVVSVTSSGMVNALYGGVAVVRAFSVNSAGEQVYADCTITVLSPLSSFNVQFDHEMDYYQSAYITSKSQIDFSISLQPQDALIRTFSYQTTNKDIATIENGKIVFSQPGRVTIKFISDDHTNGEKSKDITFYYAGDNLIEARLNMAGIENGRINLKAGENFTFSLLSMLPSDNTNLTFTLTKTQTGEVRNDQNKPVAHFEGNTLYADNGGSLEFNLFVNNVLLTEQPLVLNVERAAEGILFAEGDRVYISSASYAIVASVYPTDASEQELTFVSHNTNLANVSVAGVVTFNGFGSCEIEVYVTKNPQISRTIIIEYTKELKAIAFGPIKKENLFVDEYVDLSIVSVPDDADTFEYEMTIDNTAVAKIERLSSGDYRLKGLNQAGGEVKVTARVLGKDIFVEKIFTFYERITNIKLELDTSDDVNGQGKYRVFGNSFMSNAGEIFNTYQMNVDLKPSNELKSLLAWNSNNEDVATVDQNGLVTFVGAGRVTITVSQIVPYASAPVAKDSYEFIVVDGINVENLEQFKLAHAKLNAANAALNNNYSALVLHNNIKFDKSSGVSTINISYNVYGNGYVLDQSDVGVLACYFTISKNNVVLDNVVLRGYGIAQGVGLTEFKGKGCTLKIENCTGVLLYNSTVENGEENILISKAEVEINGGTIRNSVRTGIEIDHVSGEVSTLTVQNSIFCNSLFSGILFWPQRGGSGPNDVLILKGDVYFYNWSTLEDIEQGFFVEIENKLNEVLKGLSFVTSDVIDKVEKEVVQNATSMAIEYQGKTYYHFGVVYANVNVSVVNVEYKSFGSIDRSGLNSKCNYSSSSLVGGVNIALARMTFEINGISFFNTKPFIKPGYTPNYLLISQDCRL